jgi:outer membrane lipopolysaccharide assembly protein LptE/RlpB
MTFRLSVLGLLCLVSGLAGCAHYQLGTGAAPSFATLYVAPVENQTLLPQARALLSTQIRAAFAQDGRVVLVNSPQDAEATLEIDIRDYHRDVASVRADDTGLARKFALTLGVACTLRDNRTGQVLFADRPVSTRRDAFTDGGQLQAEYEVLPLLAESLAQKISHAVLDVW